MREVSSSDPGLGVEARGEQLPFPARVDLAHFAIRFVRRIEDAVAGPVGLGPHVLAELVGPPERDQDSYDDADHQRDEMSLHRSLPPPWASGRPGVYQWRGRRTRAGWSSGAGRRRLSRARSYMTRPRRSVY